MRKYLKLAINIPTIIWGIARWFSVAWIENYVNPFLQMLSERTGAPMPFIEGVLVTLITVGSLFWVFGKFWKKPSTNVGERHKYYVAKKVVDSKADDLLALSDALQKL